MYVLCCCTVLTCRSRGRFRPAASSPLWRRSVRRIRTRTRRKPGSGRGTASSPPSIPAHGAAAVGRLLLAQATPAAHGATRRRSPPPRPGTPGTKQILLDSDRQPDRRHDRVERKSKNRCGNSPPLPVHIAPSNTIGIDCLDFCTLFFSLFFARSKGNKCDVPRYKF